MVPLADPRSPAPQGQGDRGRGGPHGTGTWALPIGWTSAVVIGAAALLIRTPHVPGSYGICPSVLLGFACPGCGGLRATSDLLHGDVAGAWAYNPLVVIGVPLFVALMVRWFADARAGRDPWSPPTAVAIGAGVVLLAFWVLRNVPLLAPFLGPLAVP